MKTLLILTDLSPGAEHAATQALHIAQRMQTNLYLVHAFDIAKPAVKLHGNEWPAEHYAESEKQSQHALHDLSHLLALKSHENGYKPDVYIGQDVGDFSSEIHSLVADHDIAMMILGCKRDDASAETTGVSEASVVLANARIPVLFVPPFAHLEQIRKITFAVDVPLPCGYPLEFLNNFAGLFDAGIEVIHVTDENNHGSTSSAFKKMLVELDYSKAVAQEIIGHDISATIANHVLKTDTDLLVLIHHHNSFLAHWKLDGHCAAMLELENVPVMILPE